MTKTKKIIAGAVLAGGLCYLGTVVYVYHFDTQRSGISPAAGLTPENAKILKTLNQKGCDYCHTPSTPLPFYASLPVAKQLMDYDIRTGTKLFDLQPIRKSLLEGTAAPEADLAKIEWVMQYNAMPPTRYTALHWAGKMTQAERDDILGWVKHQRQTYYSTPGGAVKWQNEPVQILPNSLSVDGNKVALGTRLFHDPRLSGDGTVSCASCHALASGGVDSRKTSIGIRGQTGPINAPTVFNAAFNHQQFWDGRAGDLQAQAGGPPLNPKEMGSASWDEIIAKLDQDAGLKAKFFESYPQGLTASTITDAISEFEKTLLTPDSPFDLYLRGDEHAITTQQAHGYQLFKQNKCATCHTGKTLGGQSYEPLGLRKDYFNAEITDADIGRLNVTKNERDRFRQKVPTLRNVTLTAPYFHRGDVATLDEAVKQMMVYQVGETPSQQDVDDIVAFLGSLQGHYQPYILMRN